MHATICSPLTFLRNHYKIHSSRAPSSWNGRLQKPDLRIISKSSWSRIWDFLRLGLSPPLLTSLQEAALHWGRTCEPHRSRHIICTSTFVCLLSCHSQKSPFRASFPRSAVFNLFWVIDVVEKSAEDHGLLPTMVLGCVNMSRAVSGPFRASRSLLMSPWVLG